MKDSTIIFYAFLTLFANAKARGQSETPREVLAQQVVKTFANSTLGIENGRIDLTKYNQFKSLFAVQATAQDDYNPWFNYDPQNPMGKYTNKPEDKAFDIYAHDLALQIKGFQTINIDSIYLENKDDPNSNILVFTVKRIVTVEKNRKYVLPGNYAKDVLNQRIIEFTGDTDKQKAEALRRIDSNTSASATYIFRSFATLTITLEAKENDIFQIIQVKSKADSVECLNDKDYDAVLNNDDSLINLPGDFTAFGQPDYDLDGIPDPPKKGKAPKGSDRCWETYGKAANQGCPMDYFLTKRSFDGFAGLQMNSAKINLPKVNQLGYVDNAGNDAMDVNQSKQGSLKSQGFRPGIHAGVGFSYYFGRKEKKLGLSIGAAFSAFFADYQLTEDSVIMYTFKANDSQHDYRRRITIDSLDESIRYSIFNFPVMVTYRSYLGKEDPAGLKQRKSVINIKAGPSLMAFNTTSEYDAYISFEGLYQTGDNGIIYAPYFDPGSANNIFFTADKIFAQNPTRSAEDVFRELREANANYDFADSKIYRGKQKNESRLTVGFNLDVSLQHQISDEWAFRLGLQAVYAPLPERKEKYTPINKTTDPYNSIYNSGGKSAYSAFGLNVGLAYNF